MDVATRVVRLGMPTGSREWAAEETEYENERNHGKLPKIRHGQRISNVTKWRPPTMITNGPKWAKQQSMMRFNDADDEIVVDVCEYLVACIVCGCGANGERNVLLLYRQKHEHLHMNERMIYGKRPLDSPIKTTTPKD